MIRLRSLRPAHGRPHVGPFPGDREATPHDELRQAPRPGMPGHAGSAPTRILELGDRTPVQDRRGVFAGWLARGELVPVAKGVGPAGAIVHVITDGRHAGRIIYRHRPSVLGAGGRSPIPGGEGPA